MDYSTIILSISSLVSVIVGVVLGVVLGVWMTNYRDVKQERRKILRLRRLLGKEIQQNVDLRKSVPLKSPPDYLLFDIYQSNLGIIYVLEDRLLDEVLNHYKIVQRFDRYQHDYETGKTTNQDKLLELANMSCESGEKALKLLGSD